MEVVDTADIDYLPKARPVRRRPLVSQYDSECGYSYEHTPVFVRFTTFGTREYECSNCGDRVYLDAYTCDPDIHEMLEVGALELSFTPQTHKSTATLLAMRKDRIDVARKNAARRRKTLEEEERSA